MKTEAEFRQALRNWILSKNTKIAPCQLQDNTAIIEERIVTSLQLMDLILYLEQLTERPVDVESLKPGVFASIDSIYNNFCKDGGNVN